MRHGDYAIHLAGNIFEVADRDFFLEVLTLCKRYGFRRFVEDVHVTTSDEAEVEEKE